MAKQSVAVKVAWIGAGATVLAAVIAGVVLLVETPESGSTAIATAGGVAVSDSKETTVQVTINPGVEKSVALPNLLATDLVIRQTNRKDRVVTAECIVRNSGDAPSGPFHVQWSSSGSNEESSVNTVDTLAPGVSHNLAATFSYPASGAFTIKVDVDSRQEVKETSEDSNTISNQFNLDPRRAKVTVTFTKMHVIDDSEGFPDGEGDIWFDLQVSDSRLRWPAGNGTQNIGDDKDAILNQVITVEVTENDKVAVRVNGTDRDEGGIGNDDDTLGLVEKTYGSASEWGKGLHVEPSHGGDGRYVIYYQIDATWLDNN